MSIQAYQLPEELLPPDDFCAKVYIPNEDRYRRAFLGAYMFFGKWIAWERDDAHSAAIAASRWRDAIDRTMETWGDGCGCEDMTDEDIEQLVQRILDEMTITINNCNCGCCGGGSSSYGVDQDLPSDVPLSTMPPIIEVESPGDPPGSPTDLECAKAQYILMQWRNTALAIETGDYDSDRFSNWVNEVFTETWSWIVDNFTVIVENIGMIGNIPEGTHSAIDGVFNDIKCELLAGGSQSEIVARVNPIIDNMDVGFSTRYRLKKLLYYMPLTAPWDYYFSPVPSEYYAAGCPECSNGGDAEWLVAELTPGNGLLSAVAASSFTVDGEDCLGYSPNDGTGRAIFVDSSDLPGNSGTDILYVQQAVIRRFDGVSYSPKSCMVHWNYETAGSGSVDPGYTGGVWVDHTVPFNENVPAKTSGGLSLADSVVGQSFHSNGNGDTTINDASFISKITVTYRWVPQ